MPTHNPEFVDWANWMTQANGSWEEEVGGRLAVQGLINAILMLAPAGRLTPSEVKEAAIGWVSNEITHSPGNITEDQPKAVFDAAESFINTVTG